MTYIVSKNSLISSDTYEDIAGQTLHYPNYGERELGVDFDTGDELAELDEVLSRQLACDRCGLPIEDMEDVKEVGDYLIHIECLDEGE